MATLTHCPDCNRELQVPGMLVGQPVKCPACGRQFRCAESGAVLDDPAPPAETVIYPGTPVAAEERSFDPDEDLAPAGRPAPRPPQARPPQRTELCPYCAEPVATTADRCPHCGEDLSADDEDEVAYHRRYIRRDVEPHRGTLVLILGICSIVAAVGVIVCAPVFNGAGMIVGVIAWVMGQRDLARISEGVMDPAGEGSTRGGWICAIIGTCLNGVLFLTCGTLMLLWWGAVWPL